MECQTREFEPNVDLQISSVSEGSLVSLILTDESGSNAAISYAQSKVPATVAAALLQQHTGVLKLYDPISGSQLVALQNGSGYVSFNDKTGKNRLIQVSNCR
jgi:hypothetical protein